MSQENVQDNPWATAGDRKQFGPAEQLNFRSDEKFTIRILEDKVPLQYFFHQAPDESGGQIRAMCVGLANGCRMCMRNNEPQYVKVEKKDRPYPLTATYVGAVWVHELKAVKLLVGHRVWDQNIFPVGKSKKTVINRDFEITRRGTGRNTIYTVVAGDPTAFDFSQINVDQIPKASSYGDWLKVNVDKVLIRPDGYAPPAASAAPAPGPWDGAAPAAPAAAPAPAPAAAPAGNPQAKQALQSLFGTLIGVSYKAEVVNQLLGGNKFENLSVDDSMAFVKNYANALKASGFTGEIAKMEGDLKKAGITL